MLHHTQQQRRLLEPGRVYVLGMVDYAWCAALRRRCACFGRVASGDWLEVTAEACASGIPTKIRICCKLRLKCEYAHVARRPWRSTTCASRRSEISCRVSTSAAASESPQIGRCRLQRRPCACFRSRPAHRDGRGQGWRSLCPGSTLQSESASSAARRQLREAGASRRGTARS